MCATAVFFFLCVHSAFLSYFLRRRRSLSLLHRFHCSRVDFGGVLLSFFHFLFWFRDVALLRSRLVWDIKCRENHTLLLCIAGPPDSLVLFLPRAFRCLVVHHRHHSLQSASTKVPLWSCVSSTHTCIRPPDELHRLFFLHSFLALFLIWFLHVLTCLLASYYDHD